MRELVIAKHIPSQWLVRHDCLSTMPHLNTSTDESPLNVKTARLLLGILAAPPPTECRSSS